MCAYSMIADNFKMTIPNIQQWGSSEYLLLTQILDLVKKLDAKMGQCDCEDKDKTSYFKAIADHLGIPEVKHTSVSEMAFGSALEYLRQGKRVARKGWNGKGMWLELQVPDQNSKMTLPYIWMKTADENKVPWLASQTDMLALDWGIVND